MSLAGQFINIGPNERPGSVVGVAKEYCAKASKFDTGLLMCDIDKIQKLMKTRGISHGAEKNLKIIDRHLRSIAHTVDAHGGNINIVVRNGTTPAAGSEVYTAPFRMCEVQEFGICTTDYIVLDGNTIVTYDFSKALDAMAFEMCKLDMGYTWDGLEGALVLADVVGDNIFENTIEPLLDGGEYRAAKNLAVYDTDYKMPSGELLNYYGTAVEHGAAVNFKRGKVRAYGPAIMSSARHAGAIITSAMLGNLKNKWGASLIAVYEDKLQFVVGDRQASDFMEAINVPVRLKVHGINIVVKPKIYTLDSEHRV